MTAALCTPRPRAAWLLAAWLAGCAGAAGRSGDAPPPPPPRAARRRPDVPALVRALGHEAAAIRALPLVREVRVAVATPAQIAAELRAALLEDRAEIETERRVGVALGLLPPDLDLVDALSRFVGAEAQGYYDPESERLVLTTSEAEALGSAGPDGVEARATIVHELTHALQHQHFARRVGAADARPPPLSDAARARLALLEGDATLVTLEWLARRRGRRLLGSPELGARLERWAAGAQVLTEVDVPSYLIESAELPYEAGALAVGALYAAGGWARVDAALANEGLRAAEVLHPTREGVAYVEVPAPAGEALLARGARRVLTRALGEVELRLYLGRVMRPERAAELAAAWRGDALSLFESPAGLAAIWQIACADAAAARAVAEGLAPLAARWARAGCPGVSGSTPARCPGRVTAAGAVVTVARGE